MFVHYLKIAWRNLLKYRTQNLISIIGLGVCLLCFTICMYCSRYIWGTDACFTHHGRMAELHLVRQGGDVFSGTPVRLAENLRMMQWSTVEAIAFVVYPHERTYHVEVDEGEDLLPFDPLLCMETDSCFRQVFTPDVLAGSWEIASQTPNAVVLTRNTAERMFGSITDAIGQRMVTAAKLPYSRKRNGVGYTVQAVIEDIPENTSLCFMDRLDMLVLNDSDGLLNYQKRDEMTGGITVALLRPGVAPAKLEAELRERGLRHTLYGEDYAVCARAFGEVFWQYSMAPYFVGVSTALGLLVLLVGLLNFFYFLVGSFLNRSRECSLRRVLGSNVRQLLAQLFTQAVLVVLLAFLLTFCLIELLAPYLHLTLMKYTLVVDPERLMMQCSQYLLLVLLCSFVVCAGAVVRVRYINIQVGLRGTFSGVKRFRGRSLLLGLQYFICWLFVALAAALFLQAHRTTSTLFGTLTNAEKADILSVPLDYPFMEHADKLVLMDRMKQHAGVQDYLLSDIAYHRGVSGTELFTQPYVNAEHEELPTYILSVPENFFDFMHLPMRQGTAFRNAQEMVVDETLEKDMLSRKRESLMGRVLYDFSEGYTVSGICAPFVTDVYGDSRRAGNLQGFAFLPSDFTQYVGHCYLKCHPGRTDEVRQHVQKVLAEVLPRTITPQLSTLLEDVEEMQGIESKLKDIVLFLAVVCVVITMLGVYAAITLDTERRRKEVAIRKVNGAGLRQILLLFTRSYLWILSVSALLAFPLLYVLLKGWSQMYATFFNYGSFYWLGIFVFVWIVTALTVIFRILKAARVNPADVVKSE